MLLAGPISHTSTQYMDFVEVFNISLGSSTIYFANLNLVYLSIFTGLAALMSADIARKL